MTRINRIPEFITELKNLTDENSIKKLCERELEYLRNCLGIVWRYKDGIANDVEAGSVTGLHSQLTDYRSAVEQEITLTPDNSYYFEKGSTGSRKRVQQHLALRYLVKAPIEKVKRGELHSEQVANDMRLRKPIESKPIVEKASKLLESSAYSNLSLGIMLLSGRRSIEVLKTAKFTYKSEGSLIFEGQTKTKESENAQLNPYEIPILVKSSLLIEALNKVRKLKDFSSFTNDEIHNKCGKTLNEAVRRHFSELIPDVKVKSLRSAYVNICYHYYARDLDESIYIADTLGHSKNDTTTCNSYKDFRIID